MSLLSIFQPESLVKTEEDLLADFYRNPIVKKHLRLMAQNDSLELLSLSSSGKSDRDLAMAHEHIRGRLSTITTLLAISELSKPKE